MAKYLLNRIMQTIALLLIVSLLSFFLVSLMPSDPVYAQFGTDITQEEYDAAVAAPLELNTSEISTDGIYKYPYLLLLP